MEKAHCMALAEYIWMAGERIAHNLRNRAIAELSKKKKTILIDTLSGKQNHMLIAVRSLCKAHPEGVSLKQLAKHLGVTSASASVMVEALVSSGHLTRTVSAKDRRAVRIELSGPSTAFYDAADRAIQRRICALADTLGQDILVEWQQVLSRVEQELVLPEDG